MGMRLSRKSIRRAGAMLILAAILALPMQVAQAEEWCGDNGNQGAVTTGEEDGWCIGFAYCLDLQGADRCNSLQPILQKP
jgi:hypothetical protein